MAGVGRFVFLFLIMLTAGCVTQGPADTAGEPEVMGGGMDKEKIRTTIRDHIVPIRHCYERELKTNPKIEGKLVLEWDIEDLGKVTKISVRKSVHPKVDDCVAAVIKGTLFPSPPRGQIGRIVYPFAFSPTPVKAR